MQPHGAVHRVESQALAGLNDDPTGDVPLALNQRVAGELFPVDQVGRRRDRRTPQTGLLGRAAAVIVRVVPVASLDHLVERDHQPVVLARSRQEDRLVADVGERFEIPRRRQPDARIPPLVEQIPCAVLEVSRRGSVGAFRERLTAGLANVERTDTRPAARRRATPAVEPGRRLPRQTSDSGLHV